MIVSQSFVTSSLSEWFVSWFYTTEPWQNYSSGQTYKYLTIGQQNVTVLSAFVKVQGDNMNWPIVNMIWSMQ